MFKPTQFGLTLLCVCLSTHSFAADIDFPDNDDDDYTLQDAIDEAGAGGTVTLADGIYPVNIEITESITLIGQETARTVLKGDCGTDDDEEDCNGSGDIITIKPNESGQKVDIVIRNLTFTDADRAIFIEEDVRKVEIYNNVFVKTGSDTFTAIDLNVPEADSYDLDLSIFHNTFYQNDVAIDNDNEDFGDIDVRNNIFYQNDESVSSGGDFDDNDDDNDGLDPAGFSHNAYKPLENVEDDEVDNAALFFKSNETLNNVILAADDDMNDYFVTIVGADPDDYRFQLANNGIAFANVADDSVFGEDGNIDKWIVDEASADAAPDLGAYGGKYADPTPPPIVIQSFSLNNPAPADGDEVTITWAPFNALSFADGEYRVYAGICDLSDSDCFKSGAIVDETQAQLLMDNMGGSNDNGTITATINPLPEVQVNSIDLDFAPVDQGLEIYWTNSDEFVVDYDLSYVETDGGDLTTLGDNDLDLTSTSFIINELVNGTQYTVTLTSQSQPSMYFAIQASKPLRDDAEMRSKILSGGGVLRNEKVGIVKSSDPEIILAYAEAPQVFPTLPDEGCFIATAAHGSYYTPELLSLRAFRDEHLLTSTAGSEFVRLYYTYGPHAATWLNNNPSLKPAVRLLLVPVVSFAAIVNQLGWFGSLAIVMILMLLVGLFHQYRKRRIAVNRGECHV